MQFAHKKCAKNMPIGVWIAHISAKIGLFKFVSLVFTGTYVFELFTFPPKSPIGVHIRNIIGAHLTDG